MKREQIIEIIKSKIFTNCDTIVRPIAIESIADAILALPLDVPTDEEIKAWMIKDRDELIDHEVATAGEYMERRIGRKEGVLWAIEEIIKRNK